MPCRTSNTHCREKQVWLSRRARYPGSAALMLIQPLASLSADWTGPPALTSTARRPALRH
eukprot:2911338-Lingulodinium_polyedra.AAC.1